MTNQVIVLTQDSQARLLDYVKRILDRHKGTTTFRDKMDAIDKAYARYEQARITGDKAGMDTHGKVPCDTGVIPVVNPIVISNVQSMVAYWTEVFLSGYPIFPVVSDPTNKDQAEALEGIIQDHITLTAGDAELQIAFNDLGKYNLAAIECSWAPLPTYNPNRDISDFSPDRRITVDIKHVNKISRWNLRNTFWDESCGPSKVAEDGEYIGHTELYNRVKLKRLLNILSNEKKLAHTTVVKAALESAMATDLIVEDPEISNYTSSAKRETNWDAFAGFEDESKGRRVPRNSTGKYAVTVVYARIIPIDHNIHVPAKTSPQIWKLTVVNGSVLVSAEKLNTAQDRFPVMLTPALEDGMDMQTQSYAEMTMPIQDATTRLFNARFQSAKRAIADRALYNPDLIRPSDMRNPDPSAKIPVRANALLENPFQSAYQAIPFDTRGTEGLLQDAMLITGWQNDLTGVNAPGRGQFQKGNKTLGEFQTVMGNSDNRARLSALVIDRRALTPLKEQIKLNILMFGTDTTIIAPRTKKSLAVSIEELLATNMEFEVADGYTPKSKMASSEMLMGMINLIGTSPMLQQVYGTQLPAMVAHLASLGGLRGFDQYADVAVKEHEKNMNIQMQLMQLMQQLQQQLGGAPAGDQGAVQ